MITASLFCRDLRSFYAPPTMSESSGSLARNIWKRRGRPASNLGVPLIGKGTVKEYTYKYSCDILHIIFPFSTFPLTIHTSNAQSRPLRPVRAEGAALEPIGPCPAWNGTLSTIGRAWPPPPISRQRRPDSGGDTSAGWSPASVRYARPDPGHTAAEEWAPDPPKGAGRPAGA